MRNWVLVRAWMFGRRRDGQAKNGTETGSTGEKKKKACSELFFFVDAVFGGCKIGRESVLGRWKGQSVSSSMQVTRLTPKTQTSRTHIQSHWEIREMGVRD